MLFVSYVIQLRISSKNKQLITRVRVEYGRIFHEQYFHEPKASVNIRVKCPSVRYLEIYYRRPFLGKGLGVGGSGLECMNFDTR